VIGVFLPVLFSACLFISAATFAQTPSVTNPELEARVKALSSELRCLVCQNQTVADSDSMVARDMRDQVRAQLAAGKSEADIKTYMTDRFGDFVLYKPAFKASTVLLWMGPFFVLALGLFSVFRVVRNKHRIPATSGALSAVDQERARALLGSADSNASSS
jgi:cytochrome c-type biogenesis protein CcmH